MIKILLARVPDATILRPSMVNIAMCGLAQSARCTFPTTSRVCEETNEMSLESRLTTRITSRASGTSAARTGKATKTVIQARNLRNFMIVRLLKVDLGPKTHGQVVRRNEFGAGRIGQPLNERRHVQMLRDEKSIVPLHQALILAAAVADQLKLLTLGTADLRPAEGDRPHVPREEGPFRPAYFNPCAGMQVVALRNHPRRVGGGAGLKRALAPVPAEKIHGPADGLVKAHAVADVLAPVHLARRPYPEPVIAVLQAFPEPCAHYKLADAVKPAGDFGRLPAGAHIDALNGELERVGPLRVVDRREGRAVFRLAEKRAVYERVRNELQCLVVGNIVLVDHPGQIHAAADKRPFLGAAEDGLYPGLPEVDLLVFHVVVGALRGMAVRGAVERCERRYTSPGAGVGHRLQIGEEGCLIRRPRRKLQIKRSRAVEVLLVLAPIQVGMVAPGPGGLEDHPGHRKAEGDGLNACQRLLDLLLDRLAAVVLFLL